MSLAAMQRALTELLRSPDSIAADSERSAFAEGLASASDRLTPAMQLDIYREQFFLRHLDVLHEDFRSLAHRLGDGAFETLAKAYLKAFPPRSFTLRDLGAELPGFVASTAPWNGDTLLADLARVEWAFVEAFDAASEPALDLAAVASVPEEAWPSARLVLQPSVQRVALRHAAHDYRHAIRNGEPVAGPPEARASFVVVFRGRSALEHVELEAEAYALLGELASGTPLGEACERVAASSGATEEAFQEKVGAWFQQWTALGFLGRVELGR